MVVGEVGSILGNLQDGDQFESLVLGLWLRSRDDAQLEQSFTALGETLLEAQEQYVRAQDCGQRADELSAPGGTTAPLFVLIAYWRSHGVG